MAPESGKYFQLVSKLSGHALGLSADGGQVVTCERNEADDHQIWYEDISTGTIRVKANGQCLHVGDDNVLRLHSVGPGHSGQRWAFRDGKVQNAADGDKVLDICGSKSDPGSALCSWSFHGGPNQLWDQVFLKPEFFYLRSQLSGKVLDIEGENPEPGTKLCMWDQKPVDIAGNQLWYEGPNGVLRSRLNDFVIDSTDPSELVMQPYNSGSSVHQSWVLDGSYVALAPKLDKVLDIISQNTENGARLCAWDPHGQANQTWIVEHA